MDIWKACHLERQLSMGRWRRWAWNPSKSCHFINKKTYSPDLGFNILVLSSWSCRVSAYILRSYQETPWYIPWRREHNDTDGSFLFSKGDCIFSAEVWSITHPTRSCIRILTHSLFTRWYKASNLVFQSEHDSGGHFAAYEKPQELANDLRKMFARGGPAFGAVPVKNGYK